MAEKIGLLHVTDVSSVMTMVGVFLMTGQPSSWSGFPPTFYLTVWLTGMAGHLVTSVMTGQSPSWQLETCIFPCFPPFLAIFPFHRLYDYYLKLKQNTSITQQKPTLLTSKHMRVKSKYKLCFCIVKLLHT